MFAEFAWVLISCTYVLMLFDSMVYTFQTLHMITVTLPSGSVDTEIIASGPGPTLV